MQHRCFIFIYRKYYLTLHFTPQHFILLLTIAIANTNISISVSVAFHAILVLHIPGLTLALGSIFFSLDMVPMPVAPLVAEVLLEEFIDWPVAHVVLHEVVLVLNLQSESVLQALHKETLTMFVTTLPGRLATRLREVLERSSGMTLSRMT